MLPYITWSELDVYERMGDMTNHIGTSRTSIQAGS